MPDYLLFQASQLKLCKNDEVESNSEYWDNKIQFSIQQEVQKDRYNMNMLS